MGGVTVVTSVSLKGPEGSIPPLITRTAIGHATWALILTVHAI